MLFRIVKAYGDGPKGADLAFKLAYCQEPGCDIEDLEELEGKYNFLQKAAYLVSYRQRMRKLGVGRTICVSDGLV